MDRQEILKRNRQVYETMAAAGDPLCRPAKDDELAHPLQTVDAAGWLGDSIAGRHVLCLAAGGGRQSALYAAAGAVVTVVDLSGAMLELDRRVAAERGFAVRLVETSMDDLAMFQPAEFDIVIHPVSSCYIEHLQPVYREVARVLRPGGIYVSQHKQPASLQATTEPGVGRGYALAHSYYRGNGGRNRPIPTEERRTPAARRLREAGAVEFLHRWEELIGGLCRAGFVIEDLVEPMHADATGAPGSFSHRANVIAPYVRLKARRQTAAAMPNTASLWLP